jgi:hypothetical protein
LHNVLNTWLHTSILNGELVILILSLTLSDPNLPSTLYTAPHLNSVRLIDDSKTAIDQAPHLRSMDGRSYYRRILVLTANNALQIIYTLGQSVKVSLPMHLNYEEDHYVSTVQHHADEILPALVPALFIDEFTFYSHEWMDRV